MRYCKKGIASLEGLVIVARIGPVAKHLTDVAVRPLFTRTAVVGSMRWRIGQLLLRGTVLRVMEIKTVTDIAEEPRWWFLFGFRLGQAAEKKCMIPLQLKLMTK